MAKLILISTEASNLSTTSKEVPVPSAPVQVDPNVLSQGGSAVGIILATAVLIGAIAKLK